MENAYLQQVTDGIAVQLDVQKADDVERVRAAYRYLIENTSFGEPVGLDVWSYRDGASPHIPPYLENRALSPLLFGIGSCEDYAAALTALLRQMGFERRISRG